MLRPRLASSVAVASALAVAFAAPPLLRWQWQWRREHFRINAMGLMVLPGG